MKKIIILYYIFFPYKCFKLYIFVQIYVSFDFRKINICTGFLLYNFFR